MKINEGIKPQFLIGAINSGSGKTTFTMGILRVLKKRGMNVQSFKCGPDYIDTKFHSLATGNESVNLDTWLASKEHLDYLYHHYGSFADACVTEGVMGLFDGYQRMKGSSAEIAMLLNIPVILIINSKSMAYTVAAQIYGVKHFCPGFNLAGVIFNQVSSPNHFSFLKEACDDAGVACLGYLPKSKDLQVPSRHLGLTLGAQQEMDAQIERAARLVEENIDIDQLLSCCSVAFEDRKAESCLEESTFRIAVAKDASFNFMYRENITQLERLGKVIYFSPLAGDSLPEADLVYLPGGYPELFAEELYQNKKLMVQLKDFAEKDGRILAECGGMLYLSKSLTDKDGEKQYDMCDILPLEASMKGARLHLGYRRLMIGDEEWRGHEFHYSDVVDVEALPSVAQQFTARGTEVKTPLYRYKNVIAGYTHLYWGEKNILDLWNKKKE